MPIRWLISSTLLIMSFSVIAGEKTDAPCIAPGHWQQIKTGKEVSNRDVFRALGKTQVALLGEDHDSADHHRWQLYSIIQMYAEKPYMAIGFESFPRKVQPILDQWINNELSEEQFLKAVDWSSIWNFDPNFYMPMFQFARMYKIPMIALNIDRHLVSKVSEKGWDNIPLAEREGVSNPAAPSEDYINMLAEIFGQHMPKGAHGHGETNGESDSATPFDKNNPMFKRFVEGQILWDRAMAEALKTALTKENVSLVVGVMGAGHVMGDFGVPYQLASMKINDVITLMPWDGRMDCGDLKENVSDYAFGMISMESAESKLPKAKLGVYLEPTENGINISKLVEKSIAETSGLMPKDIIINVAGIKPEKVSDVVEAVQRTAPGTWLPLKIKRGDKEMDIIAKFPPP